MDTQTKTRKQFLLDPEKIRAARVALAARTDTEAVNMALDMAIANHAMNAAYSALLAGAPEIDDVFGRLDPPAC